MLPTDVYCNYNLLKETSALRILSLLGKNVYDDQLSIRYSRFIAGHHVQQCLDYCRTETDIAGQCPMSGKFHTDCTLQA